MPTCRACLLWSAPYDGVNPSPLQYRCDTPGIEPEEGDELAEQLKSNSVNSFTVTPPPLVLSPTPSSSDTVSTSTQTGRSSSALELEWDDIFADDELSLPGLLSKAAANAGESMEVDRCTPSPAPLPPRHIQEMRRTATRLVHGSYVEEAEFQDDVLVYDLVAQKDTKSAILERIIAATRQARGGVSSHRPGKTVMDAVSSIISTKRWSEDGDGRRCSKEQGRRQSEDCGKEVWRIKEEREDKLEEQDTRRETRGQLCVTNGLGCEDHIAEGDQGDAEGEGGSEGRDLMPNQQQQQAENAEVLVNGHSESATRDSLPPRLSHDFLSCYVELMRSLGVEPDYDDVTDDISTFRRRVRILRRKMEAEEGAMEEFVVRANSNNQDEGGEEEDTEEEDEGEEEDEEGEEDQEAVSSKRSGTRHGASFTGIGLKVLIMMIINRSFFFKLNYLL